MRRRQRTFAEQLSRSLTVAGLIYGLVIAYAVPATLMAPTAEQRIGLGPDASPLSGLTGKAWWKQRHADRFPGCVDMADWAHASVPETVVVVRRDGSLRRMSFEEAYRRARSVSAADDVWTIGACSR